MQTNEKSAAIRCTPLHSMTNGFSVFVECGDTCAQLHATNAEAMIRCTDALAACTNLETWQRGTAEVFGLSESQKIATCDNMRRNGSGFTSRIADAWLFADLGNRDKIERAFGDVIARHWRTFNREIVAAMPREAGEL